MVLRRLVLLTLRLVVGGEEHGELPQLTLVLVEAEHLGRWVVAPLPTAVVAVGVLFGAIVAVVDVVKLPGSPLL